MRTLRTEFYSLWKDDICHQYEYSAPIGGRLPGAASTTEPSAKGDIPEPGVARTRTESPARRQKGKPEPKPLRRRDSSRLRRANCAGRRIHVSLHSWNVARAGKVPSNRVFFGQFHAAGIERRKPGFLQGSKEVVRTLRAEGGAQRGCQSFRPALDVPFVLGLDHHARDRLRAGIAQHDASGFAECRFGFFESPRPLRQRLERRLRAHSHVDDLLRENLQIRDERFERPGDGNEW